MQPIIAKLILPRFGGSVAVWATCLVFFQAALLLGYAFAHHLVQRDGRRAPKFTHLALLLASLALDIELNAQGLAVWLDRDAR